MPILPEAKHELFAQAIASGMKGGEAYARAGYTAKGGKSATACAARLLATASVKARVNEILERKGRKYEITAHSMAYEFDDAAHLAVSNNAPGAMVSALAMKARLFGLIQTNSKMDMHLSGKVDLSGVPSDVLNQLRETLQLLVGRVPNPK